MVDEIPQERKRNAFWQIVGILFYIITILVLIIGVIYFIWSIVRISREIPFITVGASILNFLSLPVEVIGIFYTVMLFKHISSTCINTNFARKDDPQISIDFPSVSVLIPIYFAIPEILEKTLQSVVNSNYPREKIDILIGDDTDKSYPDFNQIQDISSKYQATFVHDTSNINFKAGMLNILFKKVKTDFVVFLDYDHKMTENFLRKSINLLTEDDELAYVQAKVSFYNIHSKLQIWESVMYAQFFEIFQKSKNKRGTVIFNGTTACFRKRIIDEIGGIPTDTFTEDIDLSIQILTKGYSSKLLEDYGSFGLIPANFSLLLSQILRWAKGSMHTLKKRWRKILFSKLSVYDKMDLFFSTSLFFIASTMYLTILFYVIMYFTNSKAIRLPIEVFPPLIIMPISFVLVYQISGILAIIFARKSSLKHMKVLDLILFSIIALALNPFTVYAVIRTIFRVKPPQKDKDVWNEKVPFIPLSIFFSLIGVGIIVIAILDFLATPQLGVGVVLLLLGLSLIATFPVSLYYHLSTRHNKPYFYQQISQNTE